MEDWSYLGCLHYFRKAETRDIGSNDYHGGDGPVRVTTPKPSNNPLFRAMIEAGLQAGYPQTDDLNGYRQEGFGPMDRTVTPNGRHASTARGYLDMARGPWPTEPDHRDPCADRSRPVQRQAGHRRGVPARNSDAPVIVTTRREVLLCNGAIGSPQILQRSGVGPGALLRELGIPIAHDLPGVGANLQDHLRCTCSAPAKSRSRSIPPCRCTTSR